ncbi:LysR family transcriptional regulator [Xanthomonas theicola]|uniref:LysR family transcriptional regulator n=2 Tax=Xanthomonas theicola TaxID=56464 RepID=A0A2S6ZAY5_9XANT|nr:LysR family transcriptional regulator [Xanthomonas theicola]PPT79287.1 LysR family transcriptional regulator [Xanthomonas theicola]QNH24116.1 LysR family transcriptional regulator [Xanthomonas theicola]
MDLNLLTALDALLQDNSVTAASARLHLTPPAVSRILARIRHVTGDDILVRSGRGLVPTPYALSIKDQVRSLVQEAAALMKPQRHLDLASIDRVFTLRGHDALLGALAPDLIMAVASLAPRVRLRFLGEPMGDEQDTMRDEVDLELGSAVPKRPEILHQVVGAENLAVAMRRGHPLAKGPLTAKDLVRFAHISVSRRGRLHGIVDALLSEAGLERCVMTSLPTSAAALDVVSRTDLITIVAETLRPEQCEGLGIVLRPVPVQLPAVSIVLSWHRRYQTDVAHTWLRARVGYVLDSVLTNRRRTEPDS